MTDDIACDRLITQDLSEGTFWEQIKTNEIQKDCTPTNDFYRFNILFWIVYFHWQPPTNHK